MRFREPLLQEYRDLASQTNAHRRGRDFELLVANMFRAAHFHVTVDPDAARPRQTDLVATLGPETYLIETKWERTAASVDEVDDVWLRLQATHGHVVGVLVSVEGFSGGAIDRVASRRERPILLIKGTELEHLLSLPRALRGFLRRKTKGLVVDGRVLFDDDERHSSPARARAPLPASEVVMVDLAGRPSESVDAQGGFNSLVFAGDLLNVDWVPGGGYGVVADLPLHAEDEDGLIGVLEVLSGRGWTSNRGRWAIQQAEVNWHGSGCRQFADALANWRQRYAPLEIVHHTEQAIYFDSLDGCLYTLSADLLAGEFRRVDHCNLSFQFIGVPLDMSPILGLAESFDIEGAVYFRSLTTRAVEGCRVPRENAIDLTPLGLLIENEDSKIDAVGESPIVTGVIVPNPFRDEKHCPSWWPIEATETEILVCDLRSWHPLSEPRTAYHLRMLEWTRTSDAFLFRPQVDWDWKDTLTGRPPWKIGSLAVPQKRTKALRSKPANR